MAFVNLSDYETQARKILDTPVLDYVDGGANDEVTLRDNPSAFGRIPLHYSLTCSTSCSRSWMSRWLSVAVGLWTR